MLKKMLSICGVLPLLSFASFSDVYEIPGGGFSTYIISFDNATGISMTFDVTAEVDSCNHHGLIGDLLPITKDYYVADLSIISTKMYCNDPSTTTQVFSKTFDVSGSWVTVLVPEDAVVSATPIVEVP